MLYKTPIIVFNEYGMNKIEIAKHNTFPLHVKFEIQLRGDMKKIKMCEDLMYIMALRLVI